MPGSGKLILTGQLGDVMKESAQAALSLVKARSQHYGVEPEILEKSDIHVHVPAGATPKDGPSAGVAMLVAGVLGGVLLVPGGIAADRWGRKPAMIAGCVVSAAGFVVYATAGSFGGVLAGAAREDNQDS